MIHQLRTYEIFDHNKDAFHRRFEQHAWRIMKSYGFEVVAFWESANENGQPLFVYLLSWPGHEIKDQAWAAFMADQEWKDIKAVSGAEHGQLVGAIRDEMLVPTAYSPNRFG